ncbi:MAG: tetratricopeptide repeat protein [Candidatus Riflebacteria bacterium]|nr:tetratricopeptide repeat protein [Candidatus Riflebacteria bacterium]
MDPNERRLQELTERVKVDPKNPEILKELGNHHFHGGNYKEAIQCYQMALDIDPRFYKALYNLGNTYYKMDDTEKAVHYWHRAIEVKPDFDHAFFNLGYHYFQKMFWKEAIRSLAEAARLNPSAADTHYYLGKCYHQTNRLAEAIEEFKKAIALAPEDPEYHYELANSSYDLASVSGVPSHFQVAVDEWTRFLKEKPQEAKARNNLCDALLQLGRHEEALAEIEKVLAREPEYPPALITKAEILERMGKTDDAVPLFNQAKALILRKDEFQPLVKYISECLRRIRLQYGKVLLNEGRAQDALQEMELIIRDDPDSCDAFDLKARILDEMGQADEATRVRGQAKTLRDKAGSTGDSPSTH